MRQPLRAKVKFNIALVLAYRSDWVNADPKPTSLSRISKLRELKSRSFFVLGRSVMIRLTSFSSSRCHSRKAAGVRLPTSLSAPVEPCSKARQCNLYQNSPV